MQIINNYADREVVGPKKGLGGVGGGGQDEEMYNMFFDRHSVYHPDCLSNILGVRDS